jgi:predicted metalloprotease with PDZ domain
MRGFVYAMKMDSYSRRASRETEAGVARPIDNIVSQLSERYRLGESVTVSDFLAELSRWLGNEATWQHFHSMLSGKVLDLADLQSSFGERHEPTAVEQELLEFGFDFPGDACSGMIEVPFTVSGLIAGSRAQQAGLENGDTVIDCDGLAACLTDFQGNVKLVVERRGLFLDIDYWPRSWAKTTSWQILEKASSSYD